MNGQRNGYTDTMRYCSAIKKDEIMPFSVTKKKIKVIMLSEVEKAGKDQDYMISFLRWNLKMD